MRQRHALYLSAAITERLAVMAETHRLSKSDILERAIQAYLTQDADGRPTHLLAQQQERNVRTLGRLDRDVAIATELLATFERYFLTITPPLPASETDTARALGQQRFGQVITGIARRLKTDCCRLRRRPPGLSCRAGFPRLLQAVELDQCPRPQTQARASGARSAP